MNYAKQVYTLNAKAIDEKRRSFSKAQEQMQKTAMSYAALYAPKKTGALIASAKAVQGGIEYTANYAAYQYYNTNNTRSYDANRGSQWFNRMKLRHKNIILQAAANVLNAKAGG